MNNRKAIKMIFRVLPCVLLMSLGTSAQEQKLKRKEVPSAVLNAFKSAYPKARIRGYAKETENGEVLYEIESTDGSRQRDILYKTDGSVVEVEETIEALELPEKAIQILRTEYSWAVVSRVEKVTENDKIRYEVSARSGKKHVNLVFEQDGTLIKK